MNYNNLTYSSTIPAANYVQNNWIHSKETNFIKTHVLARGTHLALIPASLITSAVDTLIGLGAAIGAICTVGKHQSTVKFAVRHLDNSRRIIALPYLNLLRSINPHAKFGGNDFSKDPHTRYLQSIVSDQYPLIGFGGDGFITHFVKDSLRNVARTCYNSDNFLIRHVISRLTYTLLAISSIVTRAVDGIIGIPAAALSILTGGKFESLNNLAYRGLQSPGVINDLFFSTIKIINPWAGTSGT